MIIIIYICVGLVSYENRGHEISKTPKLLDLLLSMRQNLCHPAPWMKLGNITYYNGFFEKVPGGTDANLEYLTFKNYCPEFGKTRTVLLQSGRDDEDIDSKKKIPVPKAKLKVWESVPKTSGQKKKPIDNN